MGTISGEFYRVIDSESGIKHWSFFPNELTAMGNHFKMDVELAHLLTQAHRMLGILEGTVRNQPNIEPFVWMGLFCEAQKSCAIDGILTNIEDMFLRPKRAGKELAAENYYCTLKSLKKMSITTEVICGIHKMVMEGTTEKQCGRIRESVFLMHPQYASSNAEYNPPPSEEIPKLLKDLKQFIQTESMLDTLIKAAVVYYQFETIHPFECGNGRVGRIIIPLILMNEGMLRYPFLPLSSILLREQDECRRQFISMQHFGEFSEWIRFFIKRGDVTRDFYKWENHVAFVNLEFMGRKTAVEENQNIEWKEAWHDEYLEWICGYANAYGGKLYIGKDNRGNVTGIQKSKKLMELIPSKITDTMGIVADVNLLHEGDLEYIEIIVDKYPALISYHGKYYYRSGSTMRTITGKELDKAILKSQGRTWDGMPIMKLSIDDLKQDALRLFKDKAVKRGRLTDEEVNVSDMILIDNLHLVDEDGYLIRAAMLAFYRDPEKWVTGAYIKIGYFGESDSDLQYQDEVHGPLIEQADHAVDLVYTKYLKALVAYDGIQRTEQYMFHKEAFREILLNAIIHKDYSSCNPIQISVYEDKIYVWNDGEMPASLASAEKLFQKHSSKPYNPKLANVFFKSGMIEAWGRGFDKIREACQKYNGPLPEYEINEEGIMVYCKACDKYLNLLCEKKHPVQNEQVCEQDNEQDLLVEITRFCAEPKSSNEIISHFDMPNRSYFKRHYLDKMLKDGMLKMTIPEKPSSKKQKYFS